MTNDGITYFERIIELATAKIQDLISSSTRIKAIIIVIFVVIAATSTVIALLLPSVYTFTSIIEIGGLSVDNRFSPFEQVETIRSKIENIYIPKIFSELTYNERAGITEHSIWTERRKDDQFIVLNSRGSLNQETKHKSLHNAIAHLLEQDSDRISSSIRESLETRITMLRDKINELEDDIRLTKKTLFHSEKLNGDAIKLQKNLYENMQFLLITLEREQRSLRSELGTLQLQLASLTKTHVAAPPRRSLAPTGPNRILILLSGIVMGLLASTGMSWLAQRFKLTQNNRL